MIAICDRLSTLDAARAEREVIAAAVRRPDHWPVIGDVQPLWFDAWSEQILWECLLHCRATNGGLVELSVVTAWLERRHPDDAGALLDRLADIADEYLHPEYLDHYVAMLRSAGTRRAVRRWAQVLISMCDDGRPMADIRQAIMSPPRLPAEVAA